MSTMRSGTEDHFVSGPNVSKHLVVQVGAGTVGLQAAL